MCHLRSSSLHFRDFWKWKENTQLRQSPQHGFLPKTLLYLKRFKYSKINTVLMKVPYGFARELYSFAGTGQQREKLQTCLIAAQVCHSRALEGPGWEHDFHHWSCRRARLNSFLSLSLTTHMCNVKCIPSLLVLADLNPLALLVKLLLVEFTADVWLLIPFIPIGGMSNFLF